MSDIPRPLAKNEGAVSDFVWNEAPIVMVRISALGTVVDCNAYARQLTGMDLAGVTLEKLFVDLQMRPAPLDIPALVIDNGYSRFHLPTGSGLPVNLLFRFIPVAPDEVLAIGWHDMPELTQLQQQLISLNNELSQFSRSAMKDSRLELDRHLDGLRRILEAAGEGIIGMDAEGRNTLMNPAATAMLGYGQDELIGKPCRTIWCSHYPDQQQSSEADSPIHQILTQGVSHTNCRGYFQRKDGSRFPVSLTSRPIVEHHRLLGAVITFVDMSERIRIEGDLVASEERFRSLVQRAPFGIVVTTPDGTVEYINATFTDILGYVIEDIPDIATWWQKAYPDLDYRQQVKLEWQQAVLEQAAASPVDRALVVRRKDGRSRDIKFIVVSLGDKRTLVTIQDITERKQANEQLRKLSMAIEQSSESIIITNLKAEIEYVNEAFVLRSGYRRDEAIGMNPRFLHSGKTPSSTFAAMWKSLTQGQPWKGEFHNRRKDGTEYIERAVITPIRMPDGSVTHYVAVKEDITAKKASEDQINTLAFYDPLTSLPNRRLLLDRLKQALASSARSKRYGALLYIDLDNFKTLNDTLGHDVGDSLLKEVANRLAACVREGDTVARLGGDEYVVMLEGLSEHIEESASQTRAVGEKILSALNEPYQLGSYPHHSTPSIGITLFADQQELVEDLLKRADLAMYQAKAAGRNALRFFDQEMQAVVLARAALETDLRNALLKRELFLHYQPQVVGEGRLTGVEVLLRWRHPHRGMVSPADFIPLAEDTGLILPIGHWVLETACEQLAKWAAQPALAQLSIAVNVSARQFHRKDFVNHVQSVLDQTGANPQRLKLELTESLLVEDVEGVIAKMATLKIRGVGFSLDDFGTGYSSLSYLKRLPLDQLKIDQGFVRDVLTDANDAAIAKMVIVLAESMGLSVIAEGVEIEAQRNFLLRHGCHAYQGYLFSRPLPFEEFHRFASKSFDEEQRLLRK